MTAWEINRLCANIDKLLEITCIYQVYCFLFVDYKSREYELSLFTSFVVTVRDHYVHVLMLVLSTTLVNRKYKLCLL